MIFTVSACSGAGLGLLLCNVKSKLHVRVHLVAQMTCELMKYHVLSPYKTTGGDLKCESGKSQSCNIVFTTNAANHHYCRTCECAQAIGPTLQRQHCGRSQCKLPVHAVEGHDGAWWIASRENAAEFNAQFTVTLVDIHARSVRCYYTRTYMYLGYTYILLRHFANSIIRHIANE